MRYTLLGVKPMPKKRPQSAGKVHYLPKAYTEWKEVVRAYLAANYAPTPVRGPVQIGVEFHSPTRPQGDIDNLLGAVLDAIQPARAKGDVRAQRLLESVTTLEDRLAASPGCLIADDRQVVWILPSGWVKSSKAQGIIIDLREVAP